MININRHNYEAYMLLYVDNELSAAEQQAFEQFMLVNPDLHIELKMLQGTKLIPEMDTRFNNKEYLYKNNNTTIDLHNYEEQFLYYIDNELSTSDKASVETFVLQHPSLQHSFTALQQTVLPVETIPFPNKKDLYKTTESDKPVIYLYWRRIAAAAVIIGLGISLWTIFPAKEGGVSPLQLVANNTLPKDNNTITENNHNTTLPIAGNQSSIPQSSATNTYTKIAADNQKNESVSLEKTAVSNEPVAINNSSNYINTFEPAMTIASNENNIRTLPAAYLAQELSPAISSSDLLKNTLAADNNTDPSSIVYRTLNIEDDKKSLLVGSLDINKDKLRGFLRKVSSIFRSKAKLEEVEPVQQITASVAEPFK